jgi:hypothetical protein
VTANDLHLGTAWPAPSVNGKFYVQAEQNPWKRFSENEEDGIAILFALTMVPVLGIIGGAIDYGRAFAERQHLQATADAAVIAGARAAALSVGDAKVAAEQVLASNYGTRSLVATPNISVSGDSVSVTANLDVPSYLLQIIGLPNLTVKANAFAQPAYEQVVVPPEPGGDVCILLLDGYKSESFWASGNHQVDAPNCEVHVKSVVSSAAKINMGKPLDVKRVCVEGGVNRIGNDAGLVGPIEEGCTTADDTIGATLPIPSLANCKSKPRNLKNSTEHLTPGTYCGEWKCKGSVSKIELAPGIYVFNNATWVTNADIRGTDVTIYFSDKDSEIVLNGQGSLSLSAPETGTYEGIVMYENPGITQLSSMKVNGGSDEIMSGLIYLPSRDMTWNGNSSLNADKLTMVLNSRVLLGTTDWKVEPFESKGIQAPGSGGTTEQVFRTVRLTPN